MFFLQSAKKVTGEDILPRNMP